MNYQEDFLTPGILPSRASSRKQMRQRLKSRIKPRGRPHLKQRRTTRDLNFGVRWAFTIIDVFAMQKTPKECLEACIGRLRCLIRALQRVIPFFVQLVVEKRNPRRGSGNIREVRIQVNDCCEMTTMVIWTSRDKGSGQWIFLSSSLKTMVHLKQWIELSERSFMPSYVS